MYFPVPCNPVPNRDLHRTHQTCWSHVDGNLLVFSQSKLFVEWHSSVSPPKKGWKVFSDAFFFFGQLSAFCRKLYEVWHIFIQIVPIFPYWSLDELTFNVWGIWYKWHFCVLVRIPVHTLPSLINLNSHALFVIYGHFEVVKNPWIDFSPRHK